MKSIIVSLFAAVGIMVAGSVMAGDFNTGACKACHAVDKDVVGPAFKTVTEKYGDAKTLAAVFKSGFKVEDRKVAQADGKWKAKAGIMTGMYSSNIKGHEDAAAEAIFAAVKSGKM
ncbi:MAG: cytochrome C [Gallionella sp.]|nr:cytochrome C [Gallionella sp.]MDD4946413.1 cytochrome C [Gallionella sp.]MDD5611691.1 cytochrome C [Gallionella sp.]